MNDPNKYPEGWDREKVQQVIDHYEQLTEEEAVEELDFFDESRPVTMMAIPNELLPEVRALVAASRKLPS